MRCLPFVLIAVSFAAFAQEEPDEIDTTVAVPGMKMNMNMKVKGQGAAPAPRAGAAAPSSGPMGDVAVECAPANGVQPATIKFTGLEGTRAQVYAEDGSLEGQFTLPFNFKGRGDTYYRFVVQGADGSLMLDRKIEVKMYVGCNARLGASARKGGGSVAVAVGGGAGGMSAGDFAALLQAVNEASFADDKLGVISTAAQSASFSVNQVGQLIDAISMSGDKLKALQILKGGIVDRQNNFKLLEKFTFSSDKQKAQAMLR